LESWVDMLKNLSAEKHNTFIFIEFGFKKLGEKFLKPVF
jgi:predicted GNAT family N-acyltransferase